MFDQFSQQFKRYRQDGKWQYTTMRMIHHYIPSHLFHLKRFVIFARNVDRSPEQPETLCLNARSATKADIDLLAQCGYSTFILAKWLEQGYRAWLIEHEGELLSCYWLNGSSRYFLYSWLAIEPNERDTWIVWWWVNPCYRKQGFGDETKRAGRLATKRSGFTRILGAVDALNVNAINNGKKLKLPVIERVLVLRILGVTGVCFGRKWHFGRWTVASPLALSLEQGKR